MSNETKRDVFEKTLTLYRSAVNVMNENGLDEVPDIPASHMLANYDKALPDDLPVLPKEVGEYIQWGKSYDIPLYMMYVSQLTHRPGFKKLTDDAISWIIISSNIFARAWVLGVWKVEETGEIVKLEAEK